MERRFPSCSWHKEVIPMRLGGVVTMAMGRSRRSQAAQGAPFGNGKGTSALLQAADRLWKAMSYEQNSGFLNSKGEDYFNEFLNKELEVLEQVSPAHIRRDVADIREDCRQYQAWTIRQRQEVLARLQATLNTIWLKKQEEAVQSQTRANNVASLRAPAQLRNGQAFSPYRNGNGGPPRQANSVPPVDAARASTKGQQQQAALLKQLNMTRNRAPPTAFKSAPQPPEKPTHNAPKSNATPLLSILSAPKLQPPNSPPVARPAKEENSPAAVPSGNAEFSWGWTDPGVTTQVEERGVNGAAAAPEAAESGPEEVQVENFAKLSTDDAPGGGRLTVPHHPCCVSQKYKIIVFDTETTGAKPGSRVIELGAYALESGETFDTLINPHSIEIEPEAFRAHGITEEEVRAPGVPAFREVGQPFLDFVERQLTSEGAVPVLVAHNLCVFDFKRMSEEFASAELEWPAHWEFIDTLFLARHVLPHGTRTGRHRQEDLANHFYVPREGAHRALNDVITLTQILQRLVSLAPDGHLDAVMTNPTFKLRPGGSTGIRGSLVDLQAASPAKAAANQEKKARLKARRTGGTAQPVAFKPATAEDPIEKVERARRVRKEVSPEEVPSEPRAGDVLDNLPGGWPEILRMPGGQRPFLDQPLQASKAPFTATQSKKMQSAELGLGRVLDVLQYYPRDYLEYEYDIAEDQHVTLLGTVTKLKSDTIFRKRMSRLDVTLLVDPNALKPAEAESNPELDAPLPSGEPGKLEAVVYSKLMKGHFASHTIKAMTSKMPKGTRILAQGRIGRDDSGLWKLDQNASLDVYDPEQLPPQIQPVYSQKLQMSPKDFQDAIGRALRAARERSAEERESWDCIPAHVRQQYSLMGWFEAIEQIHAPTGKTELEDARYRLTFEENLLHQLPQLLMRELSRAPRQAGEIAALPLTDTSMLEAAKLALPYKLTSGQEGALHQILQDVEGQAPMLRLLQGEVGCGKTVVAFLALLVAAGSGYQGALMAPTEVLVEQHHASLARLVDRMPEGSRPTYAALTRSTKTAERRELLADLAAGRLQILLGTHMLLSDSVAFQKLGLAVIDEQHKFGVEQRAQLQAKGAVTPHMLAMTATPIPRTLTLVTQGEMAFTAIDEMPPGRRRVETTVLEDAPKELERVYAEVAAEVANGGRAFIIYPLIEESSAERLENIRAAEEEHAKLQASGVLGAGVATGLLHGRMATEEKQAAVQRFVSGETPVLVSTTLVEVGMDVPEASIMVVNHAERYGLAKLHQLRGRVGRGTRPARCFLIASKDSAERLKVLVKEHSGLQIAEIDLAHRGPGEVMGRQQSGRDMLASLRLTKLPQDHEVMEDARQTAAELLSLYGLNPADWPPALLLSLARPDLPKLDHLILTSPGSSETPAVEVA